MFDLVRELFPAALPITGEVMDGVRELLDRHERVMARDALHASVVLTYGLDGIVSHEGRAPRVFQDASARTAAEPTLRAVVRVDTVLGRRYEVRGSRARRAAMVLPTHHRAPRTAHLTRGVTTIRCR